MMRVERLEAATATVASEVQTKTVHAPIRLCFLVINVGDVHDAAAQVERGLYGIGDARPLIAAHDHAVDNDFDEVFSAMINGRRFFDVVGFAVHAQADEAAAAHFVPHRLVLLLAAPLHWRHQIELCALR